MVRKLEDDRDSEELELVRAAGRDDDASDDEEEDEEDEEDEEEEDGGPVDDEEGDEDEEEEDGGPVDDEEEDEEEEEDAEPVDDEEEEEPAEAASEEEEDEEEEDEEYEYEEEEEEEFADETAEARPGAQNDPYWWTPWAVLFGLLLIGLLGFFGILTPRSDEPVAVADTPATPVTTPTTQATPAKPIARPTANPQDQERIGAQHLLVQYKGSLRAPSTITRSKDDAKKRAEEALGKAKKGTDFSSLVKEYSDEPGAAAREGKLGKFTRRAMVKPFSDAAFKLKVNEISGLVETPFGFHVIKRTE